MVGKKVLVARLAQASGATRLLETLPRRSLLILNYHRIGDADATQFDPGVYSCTARDLEWQVQHLARRFHLVTLQEAVAIVHGRPAAPGSILITFDDGYRDNYDLAFPIFRKHGLSAAFFLPTSFIGSGDLPWWDTIAFLINTAKVEKIVLNYPRPAEFDLSPGQRRNSIRKVLNLFKLPETTDTQRFIDELEAACGSSRQAAAAERCFMSWDEAREMQRGGMGFGSHTHSHEILSKLPYDSQREELALSRQILERELDTCIDTLAYPVGHAGSFNADTVRALADTGYTTAFSFYAGVNHPGRIQPHDVLRAGVDGADVAPVLRLRVALANSTGRTVL